MTKAYNETSFTHEINGQSYTIDCYTTSTRNGFCHHASVYIDGVEYKTISSYTNRTWERFCYQSVILQLITKLPHSLRTEFKEMFSDFEEAKAMGECNKFIERFQKAHDVLSPEMKTWIKDHTPMLETHEQAETALNAMGYVSIFDALMK